MSKFSESLPKNCPPEDAHAQKVEPIYRAVSGISTLSEIDFLPSAKLSRAPRYQCCLGHALSVFTDEKQLLDKLKRIDGLRQRFPHIAIGKIVENSGLVRLAHLSF